MDKKKVNLWEKIEKNPSEGYKEYFELEKTYLTKNLNNELIFLDIGCGDGRTLKNVYKFCKKAVGIDYNEKAFLDCKENLKNLRNVKVFLEDAKNMHFKDNSLDIIFIGLTFSNFPDKLREDILREITRVLKGSGKFIFSCYNEKSFSERMSLYNKYAPNQFEIVDEKKAFVKSLTGNEISKGFNKEDLVNILKGERFKIEEIIEGKIFYLIKCVKI